VQFNRYWKRYKLTKLSFNNVREIKEDYWERFSKETERDMGNAKKEQIRNQRYYADQ